MDSNQMKIWIQKAWCSQMGGLRRRCSPQMRKHRPCHNSWRFNLISAVFGCLFKQALLGSSLKTMDGLDGWWNPQIYANWLHKEAIRGTDLFMDFKGMEWYSCSNDHEFFFEMRHYEQFRWFQRQCGLQLTKDNINNSKLDFDQLFQSDAESDFEGFFA